MTELMVSQLTYDILPPVRPADMPLRQADTDAEVIALLCPQCRPVSGLRGASTCTGDITRPAGFQRFAGGSPGR
jgi:hypothetical protein